MSTSKHPLMSNNITRSDREALAAFILREPAEIFTNNKQVRAFEQQWGKWLGTSHNVMVNSGASANELTMLTLKQRFPSGGEVIVPPITWVSDIASVIHNGFVPVFCDINPRTLALDENAVKNAITSRTRAVFLTHVLGYNGLTDNLINLCKERGIILIEDVCESHGATFKGQKVGTFGWVSNFSFYYAHHLTSIEGGMICTTDPTAYEYCRMFRSHGMVRESDSQTVKESFATENTHLNPDFIFSEAAYNFRSTELNAVLAQQQLPRLDANNRKRQNNLDLFLDSLDGSKYYVDFDRTGNSNYAFTVVLNEHSFTMRDRVEHALKTHQIEFRRGLSGGGSQVLQPYINKYNYWISGELKVATHCHHFGWYIGNYPDLESNKITDLTRILNAA